MSTETHEPVLLRQDVTPQTKLALDTACRDMGIDSGRDLLLTDAPDHPAGPGVRFRAWIRIARDNGSWSRMGGRHEATAQAAAESLLVKLTEGRA